MNLLLTVLLMCSAQVLHAYDFVVDGIYYDKDTKNQTATVTYKEGQYSGTDEYSGVVHIPNEVEYDGVIYPVTKIGSYAFYSCKSLIGVVIPNSVTVIDVSAFSYCGSLADVSFPNSVSEETTSVISINTSAFLGCTSLKKIVIPNSIRSVGNNAFAGCSELTDVTIADSSEPLYTSGAPFGQSSTASTVFGYTCFLEKLYLGRNVIHYENATYGFGSPFQNIKSLTTVVIGDAVTEIPSSAFAGCSGITDVTIHNGVNKIGESTFNNCTSLTELVIPNSVTEIGASAFRNCSSLAKIDISNSVTSIEEYTFTFCASLAELTLPHSITTIGTSAFYGCSSLTELVIPNSVTYLGEGFLGACTSVTSVVLPNSIKQISAQSFQGCTRLESITIPESVTSIGQWAFRECSELTSVTIPSNVVFIAAGAFYNCIGMKEVIIADGANTLEFGNAEISTSNYDSYNYFGECPIEKIYMGRNIEYTDSWGWNCPFTGLKSATTSVIMGDSVTMIGDNVFYECSSLTELNIGNNVTSIGRWSFQNCSGLTSVVIPSGVMSISNRAFAGCSSLVSITSLNPTPPEIDESTFDEETEQNATLYVPEGSETAYQQHPYWKNFFGLNEDEPNGIEMIGTDSEGAVDAIYTINGVKCNTTNLADLPNGIYLIGGKKVFINR